MKSKDDKIKKLLLNYRDILNQLRNLGGIRTGKVVGDYGEYIASKKLNLELQKSTNKGYDAIDSAGKKYEIKSRKATHYNKPGVFRVKEEQLQSSDFLIYVEFDDVWNLFRLLKIPTSNVISNKHGNVSVNKELVEKFSIL